jgi:UDP-2-acetamido-2,6-beta-L-arabino-hexul-4-ose reductase
MPTLHTHNITNTGSAPLTTLFWTQEIFDAANPDTYVEAV